MIFCNYECVGQKHNNTYHHQHSHYLIDRNHQLPNVRTKFRRFRRDATRMPLSRKQLRNNAMILIDACSCFRETIFWKDDILVNDFDMSAWPFRALTLLITLPGWKLKLKADYCWQQLLRVKHRWYDMVSCVGTRIICDTHDIKWEFK